MTRQKRLRGKLLGLGKHTTVAKREQLSKSRSQEDSLPAEILRGASRVPAPRGAGTRDAPLRMSAG